MRVPYNRSTGAPHTPGSSPPARAPCPPRRLHSHWAGRTSWRRAPCPEVRNGGWAGMGSSFLNTKRAQVPHTPSPLGGRGAGSSPEASLEPVSLCLAVEIPTPHLSRYDRHKNYDPSLVLCFLFYCSQHNPYYDLLQKYSKFDPETNPDQDFSPRLQLKAARPYCATHLTTPSFLYLLLAL